MKKKDEIEVDEEGYPIMSLKNVLKYCEKDELYDIPELNNKIYLHYKGFKKI